MPVSPQLLLQAPPEKLEALREIRAENARLRREKARRQWPTPGALARHCEPTTLQTPALDAIDAVAVQILDGETRKQLISAPPQTGKSERISRWTPLWLLCCDPTLRIAIVSATKDLAVRWGRKIKRDLEANPDLGLVLREDSKAAGRFETEGGGSILCVGVATGTTGHPVDVLIVDDPIADRAAAESKTMRDRVWDFWENDAGLRSRKAIIMSTRWHVDDLAGRLTLREPSQWTSLSIPAIAKDDDPLGRAVGAELQSANPELHPPGYYHLKQATTSAYVWSALFQQSPTAGEGNIFKRGDWRFWRTGDERSITLGDDAGTFDLADCVRFITMDLASSTKTSSDWTVASAWAITLSGDLVLLDRKRKRVPETDHAEFLAPLRQRWMQRYDVTHIESAMFGTTLVYALGRAGVPVAELKAKGDKRTRALPAAGLVRQHRVWLPVAASWLDEWLDEHADFDKGTHDDQVDTMSYAAQVVLEHWLPMESAEAEKARELLPVEQYADLMSVPLY